MKQNIVNLIVVLLFLGVGVLAAIGNGSHLFFVKNTALSAIIFLLLAIIPANISRIISNQRLKIFNAKMVNQRRNFGIIFGWLIVSHVLFAIYSPNILRLDFSYLLKPQFFLSVISFGFLIFMLITSLTSIQKKFMKWRSYHSVIWLILPLIWQHSLAATKFYDGQYGLVSYLVLVLVIFSVLKYFGSGNSFDYKRDLSFTLFGILIVIIYNLLYFGKVY